GSAAPTTMALTAALTSTWATCARRLKPTLNNPRISRPSLASAINSGVWMMLHSLRFRLILMFMLVVMVAVGTVALLASQATSSNLQIYNQAKDNQQVVSTILAAYNQHQSQSALQKLVEQLAHSS